MSSMHREKGIADFLLQHREGEPVSFHMPGHKGAELYKRFGYETFLSNFMDCDITEIHGADNLFQAESIIKYTMNRYKELYEVRKSYLLVNGTSCGLIAAIMTAVKPGGRLIMARNCHKSVFNALTLGNISPVYAYPEVIKDSGISGEILPKEIERLLTENPDAEAVIIPSPNYYGICSDIKSIAELVHQKGKSLIVDQAHGAHLKFFSRFTDSKDNREDGHLLPQSAEECGADIVVNSIHKTLASFTQSAVLNVNTDKIDLGELEDKLQMMESTSPSYLLMASLDINADLLEGSGKSLIQDWKYNLTEFYKAAGKIEGLKVINTGSNMDWTKINLDMSFCGLSGHELEKYLMRENIFVELVTGNIVMCMTGIGNVTEDYERLLQVLRKISETNMSGQQKEAENHARVDFAELSKDIPRQEKLHEIPKKKKHVALEQAQGLVCALSIIPYPPGIPLICPGELISREAMEYVKALRDAGEKVMGIDENNQVLVGDQESL